MANMRVPLPVHQIKNIIFQLLKRSNKAVHRTSTRSIYNSWRLEGFQIDISSLIIRESSSIREWRRTLNWFHKHFRKFLEPSTVINEWNFAVCVVRSSPGRIIPKKAKGGSPRVVNCNLLCTVIYFSAIKLRGCNISYCSSSWCFVWNVHVSGEKLSKFVVVSGAARRGEDSNARMRFAISTCHRVD